MRINGSSLLVFSLGSEIFSSLSNSFVSNSFVSTSFFKLMILSSLCTTFSSLGSSSVSSFFELPPIIDPRTAPTSTVEPFWAFISLNTPSEGDGTSKFTLSVSSSTTGSSASVSYTHLTLPTTLVV